MTDIRGKDEMSFELDTRTWTADDHSSVNMIIGERIGHDNIPVKPDLFPVVRDGYNHSGRVFLDESGIYLVVECSDGYEAEMRMDITDMDIEYVDLAVLYLLGAIKNRKV